MTDAVDIAEDPPPEIPLAVAIAKAVRQHELDRADQLGGPSPGIVFEVLNALACNAAVVLAGCNGDPRARELFNHTLEKSLQDQLAAPHQETLQ